MPSKELIEKVTRAMCEQDGANWNAQNCLQTASGDEPEQQREYWRDKAQAAIDIVLNAAAEAAKQWWHNPTCERPDMAIRALAASALGEQSE